MLILLTGCLANFEQPVQEAAPITVETVALNQPQGCSGRFVSHDLPHVTAAAVERVAYFISNGSGLAANDLDNDGDIDLVLANIFGPNRIFWNDGGWQFRAEVLWQGSARAVAIVDVDGDGRLDITLTTRIGEVKYWRNLGLNRQFEAQQLPGVRTYAYAMSWADLDIDGDLDLVTASYDASLEKQLGEHYKLADLAGVTVYRRQAGHFEPVRLATASQALALQLVDLNQDNRLDLLVGNDFDTPDQAWLAAGDDWQATTPFSNTTFSTMSFAAGDLNNDGYSTLFAADMHPYSDAPEIMAQWQPVLETMPAHHTPGDPQIMENVLQMPSPGGGYVNRAAEYGVAASGWSWSTQLGDLDQDGFLDLYVVNGMASLELFNHLPDDELIEENQAYRNEEGRRFVAALEWGLNSRRGGRGMSMTDLDNDGDLDIVINNLRAPAQLFENQLCQGESLAVDLYWPESGNTRALGARVTLQTSSGHYTRTVQAGSGYLSGDSAQLHFGFPAHSQLQQLSIRWPDGRTSHVSSLTPHTLLRITRR